LPYERQGDVNGVVFPCGWILDKPSGAIRLYYGGADTCVAGSAVFGAPDANGGYHGVMRELRRQAASL